MYVTAVTYVPFFGANVCGMPAKSTPGSRELCGGDRADFTTATVILGRHRSDPRLLRHHLRAAINAFDLLMSARD